MPKHVQNPYQFNQSYDPIIHSWLQSLASSPAMQKEPDDTKPWVLTPAAIYIMNMARLKGSENIPLGEMKYEPGRYGTGMPQPWLGDTRLLGGADNVDLADIIGDPEKVNTMLQMGVELDLSTFDPETNTVYPKGSTQVTLKDKETGRPTKVWINERGLPYKGELNHVGDGRSLEDYVYDSRSSKTQPGAQQIPTHTAERVQASKSSGKEGTARRPVSLQTSDPKSRELLRGLDIEESAANLRDRVERLRSGASAVTPTADELDIREQLKTMRSEASDLKSELNISSPDDINNIKRSNDPALISKVKRYEKLKGILATPETQYANVAKGRKTELGKMPVAEVRSLAEELGIRTAPETLPGEPAAKNKTKNQLISEILSAESSQLHTRIGEVSKLQTDVPVWDTLSPKQQQTIDSLSKHLERVPKDHDAAERVLKDLESQLESLEGEVPSIRAAKEKARISTPGEQRPPSWEVERTPIFDTDESGKPVLGPHERLIDIPTVDPKTQAEMDIRHMQTGQIPRPQGGVPLDPQHPAFRDMKPYVSKINELMDHIRTRPHTGGLGMTGQSDVPDHLTENMSKLERRLGQVSDIIDSVAEEYGEATEDNIRDYMEKGRRNQPVGLDIQPEKMPSPGAYADYSDATYPEAFHKPSQGEVDIRHLLYPDEVYDEDLKTVEDVLETFDEVQNEINRWAEQGYMPRYDDEAKHLAISELTDSGQNLFDAWNQATLDTSDARYQQSLANSIERTIDTYEPLLRIEQELSYAFGEADLDPKERKLSINKAHEILNRHIKNLGQLDRALGVTNIAQDSRTAHLPEIYGPDTSYTPAAEDIRWDSQRFIDNTKRSKDELILLIHDLKKQIAEEGGWNAKSDRYLERKARIDELVSLATKDHIRSNVDPEYIDKAYRNLSTFLEGTKDWSPQQKIDWLEHKRGHAYSLIQSDVKNIATDHGIDLTRYDDKLGIDVNKSKRELLHDILSLNEIDPSRARNRVSEAIEVDTRQMPGGKPEPIGAFELNPEKQPRPQAIGAFSNLDELSIRQLAEEIPSLSESAVTPKINMSQYPDLQIAAREPAPRKQIAQRDRRFKELTGASQEEIINQNRIMHYEDLASTFNRDLRNVPLDPLELAKKLDPSASTQTKSAGKKSVIFEPVSVPASSRTRDPLKGSDIGALAAKVEKLGQRVTELSVKGRGDFAQSTLTLVQRLNTFTEEMKDLKYNLDKTGFQSADLQSALAPPELDRLNAVYDAIESGVKLASAELDFVDKVFDEKTIANFEASIDKLIDSENFDTLDIEARNYIERISEELHERSDPGRLWGVIVERRGQGAPAPRTIGSLIDSVKATRKGVEGRAKVVSEVGKNYIEIFMGNPEKVSTVRSNVINAESADKVRDLFNNKFSQKNMGIKEIQSFVYDSRFKDPDTQKPFTVAKLKKLNRDALINVIANAKATGEAIDTPSVTAARGVIAEAAAEVSNLNNEIASINDSLNNARRQVNIGVNPDNALALQEQVIALETELKSLENKSAVRQQYLDDLKESHPYLVTDLPDATAAGGAGGEPPSEDPPQTLEADEPDPDSGSKRTAGLTRMEGDPKRRKKWLVQMMRNINEGHYISTHGQQKEMTRQALEKLVETMQKGNYPNSLAATSKLLLYFDVVSEQGVGHPDALALHDNILGGNLAPTDTVPDDTPSRSQRYDPYNPPADPETGDPSKVRHTVFGEPYTLEETTPFKEQPKTGVVTDSINEEGRFVEYDVEGHQAHMSVEDFQQRMQDFHETIKGMPPVEQAKAWHGFKNNYERYAVLPDDAPIRAQFDLELEYIYSDSSIPQSYDQIARVINDLDTKFRPEFGWKGRLKSIKNITKQYARKGWHWAKKFPVWAGSGMVSFDFTLDIADQMRIARETPGYINLQSLRSDPLSLPYKLFNEGVIDRDEAIDLLRDMQRHRASLVLIGDLEKDNKAFAGRKELRDKLEGYLNRYKKRTGGKEYIQFYEPLTPREYTAGDKAALYAMTKVGQTDEMEGIGGFMAQMLNPLDTPVGRRAVGGGTVVSDHYAPNQIRRFYVKSDDLDEIKTGDKNLYNSTPLTDWRVWQLIESQDGGWELRNKYTDKVVKFNSEPSTEDIDKKSRSLGFVENKLSPIWVSPEISAYDEITGAGYAGTPSPGGTQYYKRGGKYSETAREPMPVYEGPSSGHNKIRIWDQTPGEVTRKQHTQLARRVGPRDVTGFGIVSPSSPGYMSALEGMDALQAERDPPWMQWMPTPPAPPVANVPWQYGYGDTLESIATQGMSPRFGPVDMSGSTDMIRDLQVTPPSFPTPTILPTDGLANPFQPSTVGDTRMTPMEEFINNMRTTNPYLLGTGVR